MRSRSSVRRRRARVRRRRAIGLLIVLVAAAAAFGDRLPASPTATVLPSVPSVLPSAPTASPSASSAAPATPTARVLRRESRGAGSSLPAGTTVFEDELPGVANLDPALLEALRRAAFDAAEDGVTFEVTSGRRSRAYQERLLADAIAQYGSEREAARWVATADTSPHVSGDAVDLGPDAATRWLSAHGAAYGLCQIYGNEPWHYELRPDAVSDGCPAMYADPTHDPRMYP